MGEENAYEDSHTSIQVFVKHSQSQEKKGEWSLNI